MSDVFDEIIIKLKEKAKTPEEALHILANEKLQKFYKNYKNKEWVRLEDVESAIQQLKQNYVLVSKEWLNKRLEEERQRTKFIDASDSHQAIGKIDLILEMLQRGSRGVVEE